MRGEEIADHTLHTLHALFHMIAGVLRLLPEPIGLDVAFDVGSLDLQRPNSHQFPAIPCTMCCVICEHLADFS